MKDCQGEEERPQNILRGRNNGRRTLLEGKIMPVEYCQKEEEWPQNSVRERNYGLRTLPERGRMFVDSKY